MPNNSTVTVGIFFFPRHKRRVLVARHHVGQACTPSSMHLVITDLRVRAVQLVSCQPLLQVAAQWLTRSASSPRPAKDKAVVCALHCQFANLCGTGVWHIKIHVHFHRDTSLPDLKLKKHSSFLERLSKSRKNHLPVALGSQARRTAPGH